MYQRTIRWILGRRVLRSPEASRRGVATEGHPYKYFPSRCCRGGPPWPPLRKVFCAKPINTMSDPVVTIIPLVPNLTLPTPASPRTRSQIPEGYGVQEQCLPFTAASGLGVLIPSPVRFGLCNQEEVPEGARTFRSPLQSSEPEP